MEKLFGPKGTKIHKSHCNINTPVYIQNIRISQSLILYSVNITTWRKKINDTTQHKIERENNIAR